MSTQPPSFFDNWRTLPEELKLRILTLTVMIESTSRGLQSYYHLDEARYWNFHPFCSLVVPLLSCSDIKHLVLEAFYTGNKFRLEYHMRREGLDYAPPSCICLPPGQVQNFVRRLHIAFEGAGIEVYDILEHASNALQNLPNLSVLDISMGMLTGHSAMFRQRLDNSDGFEFPAKCMRVAFQHTPLVHQGRMDELETKLLDKFSLKAKVEVSKTIWTRFIREASKGYANGNIREVSTWAMANTILHYTRLTVKEVAIKGHRHELHTKFDPRSALW